LDEADTFIHNSEELRGILNSGYRRSGSYVIRTVGEDFDPVVFNTFGPKAVAQIDMPPETIVDRGIVINMERKKRARSRNDCGLIEFPIYSSNCDKRLSAGLRITSPH